MPSDAPQTLLMNLVTPLGEGVLKFSSMSASEELSRLYEIQVIALAESQDIAVDDLLGSEVGVSVEVADDSKRWFQGIVTAVGLEGVAGRYFSYRLTLRPWLWLLTRSANVRVFQEMSVPDILQEVLGAYTGQVTLELSATYEPRTYCVQYRETDFNFVSRLMEQEGIFYFFRHSEGSHQLVLADAASVHVTTPGFETVKFLEDEGDRLEEQAITAWRFRHEIQSGKFELRHYDFMAPDAVMTGAAASSREHAEGAHEVYDYTGSYTEGADGATAAARVRALAPLATLRRDEQESRHARVSGHGNTPGLVSGARFTLEGHPRDDQNAEHIVLSTQIEMQQAGYESGAGDDTRFVCHFSALDAREPFRPARTTRKPTVAGPQTARVVGEGDDGDITVDEHARVKVQFHWDRVGENNASSSCWVRVATPSAGNGWGMLSLPRQGQEVVVDFLEGDPDQPLITGRVFNAAQKPPYELPANATVSTFKSRSKNGAAADFNELRFEDKAGEEYLLLHAQKDRFEFVEGTLKSTIGIGDGVGDEHRTVKNDRKEKIGGEHHLAVTKDFKHKVEGKMGVTVVQDISFKGDAKFSLKTAEDFIADAGATISFKSGGDLHLKIGANIGADAAQNVHIKGGMNIVIEGGMQISIKAGSSSVVLGPDGVSITGSMVKINSGGAPGSGAGASPEAPTAPDAPVDAELPEDPLTHR